MNGSPRPRGQQTSTKDGAEDRRILFPMEVEWVQQDWSPKGFAVTELVAFGLVLALTTEAGRTWFDIDLLPVLVVTATHFATYAICVFVVGWRRMLLPRFWPVRLIECFTSVSLAAIYGAAAHGPVSPAWAFHLVNAMVWARASPGSPFHAGVLVLLPIGLRLVWVPAPDFIGLAVAFAMGTLAALVFFLASRSVLAGKALARRAEAHASLTALCGDRAAALYAAMGLHDGLSGALFAARQRVKRAEVGEMEAIAKTILERARGLVADILASGFAREVPFDQALAAASRIAGDRAEVRIEGAPEGTPDDLADVVAIVAEAAANAARHGEGGPVEIIVRFAAKRVEILCTSPLAGAPTSTGRGRGLRNIALRAASHGGSASVDPRGGVVVLEASWPLRAPEQAERRVFWLELAIFVAVALAFGAMTSWGASLLVLAVGLSFIRQLASLFRGRREALRAAAERRQALERSRSGALVEEAFGRELASLEESLEQGEPRGIEAALDRLAERLGGVLDRLESAEPSPAAESSPAVA